MDLREIDFGRIGDMSLSLILFMGGIVVVLATGYGIYSAVLRHKERKFYKSFDL